MSICSSLQYGRSGLGKSWVLTHAAIFIAKRFGLRMVRVSRPEIKTLDKLLEEVRLHPNVRFAILLDDLTFKAGEEGAVAFKQLLEGSYEVKIP
jgi:predicted AAA+ superfamily ATPase